MELSITYVLPCKAGKSLEYDNAPDWLIAYMRYRRTALGNALAMVIKIAFLLFTPPCGDEITMELWDKEDKPDRNS